MPFDVKFLISAVSGLLLILVVGGLIFNAGFRKDLVASEGKASLFGIISVEGVMVLVLCALFVFGMIYPITKDANAPEIQGLANTVKAQDVEITNLNTDIDMLETNKTDLEERVLTLESVNTTLDKANSQLKSDSQALTLQNERYNNGGFIAKQDVVKFVEELDLDDDLSKSFRQVQANRKGPWSIASGTLEVVISVPGNLKPGRNRSCQKYYKKRVELITDYKQGNNISRHEVKVKGLIAHTHDCRELFKIDFQLSCDDAKKLYSSEVLECDENNNPLWKEGVTHKLPARATILQSEVSRESDHINSSRLGLAAQPNIQ